MGLFPMTQRKFHGCCLLHTVNMNVPNTPLHPCWIVALNELTLFVVVFSRNRAIADYLRSNGHEEAYSVFKKEAELDMVS